MRLFATVNAPADASGVVHAAGVQKGAVTGPSGQLTNDGVKVGFQYIAGEGNGFIVRIKLEANNAGVCTNRAEGAEEGFDDKDEIASIG